MIPITGSPLSVSLDVEDVLNVDRQVTTRGPCACIGERTKSRSRPRTKDLEWVPPTGPERRLESVGPGLCHYAKTPEWQTRVGGKHIGIMAQWRMNTTTENTERPEPARRTYTVEEAARSSQSVATSRTALRKSGELPTVRLGRRLLVPRDALKRCCVGSSVMIRGRRRPRGHSPARQSRVRRVELNLNLPALTDDRARGRPRTHRRSDGRTTRASGRTPRPPPTGWLRSRPRGRCTSSDSSMTCRNVSTVSPPSSTPRALSGPHWSTSTKPAEIADGSVHRGLRSRRPMIEDGHLKLTVPARGSGAVATDPTPTSEGVVLVRDLRHHPLKRVDYLDDGLIPSRVAATSGWDGAGPVDRDVTRRPAGATCGWLPRCVGRHARRRRHRLVLEDHPGQRHRSEDSDCRESGPRQLRAPSCQGAEGRHHGAISPYPTISDPPRREGARSPGADVDRRPARRVHLLHEHRLVQGASTSGVCSHPLVPGRGTTVSKWSPSSISTAVASSRRAEPNLRLEGHP